MRAVLAWSGLHADAAMAGCIAAGRAPMCDYYADRAGPRNRVVSVLVRLVVYRSEGSQDNAVSRRLHAAALRDRWQDSACACSMWRFRACECRTFLTANGLELARLRVPGRMAACA